MANFNSGINRSLSFLLFSRPSFLEGMSRIVDFGGTLNMYNDSKTPEEADNLALSNDWKMIGRDLKSAVEEYERTTRVSRSASKE